MYTTSSAAVLTVTKTVVFCLRFTVSSLQFNRREAYCCFFLYVDRQTCEFRLFMPDPERVFSRRDILQNKLSVPACRGEVRSFRDNDISRHLGVHIAEHRPHAGFIKQVVFRSVLRVRTQIETRWARREHVVPDLVAIRKSNGSA